VDSYSKKNLLTNIRRQVHFQAYLQVFDDTPSQTQFRTSTANVEQLRLLKHCNKRASTH